MGNFWPGALVDLVSSLEGERKAEALKSLENVCGLGHSSGMDLATGFLVGLDGLGCCRSGPPVSRSPGSIRLRYDLEPKFESAIEFYHNDF